jgi:predicted phosphodiesterase
MRERALRAILCAVALAAIFSGGCAHVATGADAWKEPWNRDARFVVGPYLVYLGAQQGFAVVVGNAPAPKQPPVISWWAVDSARGDARRRATMKPYGPLWTATLAGLAAGGRYAYQVVTGATSGRVHEFIAGAAKNDDFRFIVYGDTRTGHIVHWRVVEAMARERVSFAVHTGDMVTDGGQRDQWHRFFGISRSFAARHPIIAAFGTHEPSNEGLFRHHLLLDSRGEQRYYRRDWGRLRMVMMNSEQEYRPGSSQHAFVERELADGAARNMLMLITTHVPPFSSGPHGSNLQMRGVLLPLCKRYGVELVVSGHDHNYERAKPVDGTTFIVSGSSGAPIRPIDPKAFSAKARTEPHYVLVDVDAGGLTLRAVNLQGQTFDTYVIKPNPPRGK